MSSDSAVDVEALAQGILAGQRAALAKAITLVESTRPEAAERGWQLLERVLPHTGKSLRIGVTGVPGVGKSTFIEAFGLMLIERGHRVAVLAVDPSSRISGGSILGDKARMSKLAQSDEAYIRPSPNATTLGGVARRTREALLLVEAAGFDVVLVETVGVGQSEISVCDMTDFFLVLMLPGAGDELQGIKKGIIELADLIAVNKADGGTKIAAEAACAEYAAALSYLRPQHEDWQPRALCVSSLKKRGLDAIWDAVLGQRKALKARGRFETRRQEQRRTWFWAELDAGLRASFLGRRGFKDEVDEVEGEVVNGSLSPSRAARRLLSSFWGGQDLT
ncbi:MAG: methylmalonyl Co-A mutase-associated GTPase MeaB [Planctomycetota bacterium]